LSFHRALKGLKD